MAIVLKTSPMLASEKPIGPSNQYSIFSILKKVQNIIRSLDKIITLQNLCGIYVKVANPQKVFQSS